MNFINRIWRCFILQFGKKLGLVLLALACIVLAVSASAEYYVELPANGVAVTNRITMNLPGENPVIPGYSPITGNPWSGRYYPIL